MRSASRRFPVLAVFGLGGLIAVCPVARAQDASAPPLITSASVAQAIQASVTAPVPVPSVQIPSRVSFLLQPLYVATAAVQALDARSTFKALDAGAVESNSLVAPLATHRAAFVALKVTMAAAFIYNGHTLGKRHRLLAAAALTGINAMYTAIVWHNYNVARQMAAPQVARPPQ